ncbi:MAG: terminase gpA endonuclease subunit, partial [Sphingomonas sp.]
SIWAFGRGKESWLIEHRVLMGDTARDAVWKRLAEMLAETWTHASGAAMPLVDTIGMKLDVLAGQLKTLNEAEPAAAEVRKLVGEQLPELIKGYQRVPDNLRGVDRFGQSPDKQLVDGLALIDQEISQMSAQLAQGDLDALATRGRYLQIRYRGDDEVSG